MSQGSGLQWMGVRRGRGRETGRAGVGVVTQRHPRLMSGEQRTTGDRAEREERQR